MSIRPWCLKFGVKIIGMASPKESRWWSTVVKVGKISNYPAIGHSLQVVLGGARARYETVNLKNLSYQRRSSYSSNWVGPSPHKSKIKRELWQNPSFWFPNHHFRGCVGCSLSGGNHRRTNLSGLSPTERKNWSLKRVVNKPFNSQFWSWVTTNKAKKWRLDFWRRRLDDAEMQREFVKCLYENRKSSLDFFPSSKAIKT